MVKDCTKPQSWTESKLQKEIILYCRKKYDWDIRTPAGTPGIRDGSPDYMIPISGGKVLFIEFKSPMKKNVVYRPFQEETILNLRKLGHIAFATKDYNLCKKIIDCRDFDDIILNSGEVLLENIELNFRKDYK